MAAAKRHFSDITFYSPFVRVRLLGEGEGSCVAVEAKAYDSAGEQLVGCNQLFACDGEGYMPKRAYDLAMAYGLGLAETIGSLRENGMELLDACGREKLLEESRLPELPFKRRAEIYHAIAAAAKEYFPTSEITAMRLDPEALGCTAEELDALGAYIDTVDDAFSAHIAIVGSRGTVGNRSWASAGVSELYEAWAGYLNTREGLALPGVYCEVAGIMDAHGDSPARVAGTIDTGALREAIGARAPHGMTWGDERTLEDYLGRKLFADGDAVTCIRIAPDTYMVKQGGCDRGDPHAPDPHALYLPAAAIDVGSVIAPPPPRFTTVQEAAPDLAADLAALDAHKRTGTPSTRNQAR